MRTSNIRFSMFTPYLFGACFARLPEGERLAVRSGGSSAVVSLPVAAPSLLTFEEQGVSSKLFERISVPILTTRDEIRVQYPTISFGDSRPDDSVLLAGENVIALARIGYAQQAEQRLESWVLESLRRIPILSYNAHLLGYSAIAYAEMAQTKKALEIIAFLKRLSSTDIEIPSYFTSAKRSNLRAKEIALSFAIALAQTGQTRLSGTSGIALQTVDPKDKKKPEKTIEDLLRQLESDFSRKSASEILRELEEIRALTMSAFPVRWVHSYVREMHYLGILGSLLLKLDPEVKERVEKTKTGDHLSLQRKSIREIVDRSEILGAIKEGLESHESEKIQSALELIFTSRIKNETLIPLLAAVVDRIGIQVNTRIRAIQALAFQGEKNRINESILKILGEHAAELELEALTTLRRTCETHQLEALSSVKEKLKLLNEAKRNERFRKKFDTLDRKLARFNAGRDLSAEVVIDGTLPAPPLYRRKSNGH